LYESVANFCERDNDLSGYMRHRFFYFPFNGRFSRETLNHGVNELHCDQKEDLTMPEDFCHLFLRKSFLQSKIKCKNVRVIIHDLRATC
jgi:hypothetical protein